MTAQDQSTTKKAITSTNELSMQTATISETTRNFLVILGKLSDIYENISDTIEPICGERQLDEATEPAFEQLGNVKSEVVKLLNWSISENMSIKGSQEI